MSSPVRFELASSPLLAAGIIGAHLAAGIAVYTVMDGWAAVVLAVGLFALGAAAAWSRALLRSSASVRAFELGGEAAVFELAGGERLSAAVGNRRYVTRYVVALPLRAPASRTLLITADMLGPQEFRHLRLWALWNRLPSEPRNVAPAQLVS